MKTSLKDREIALANMVVGLHFVDIGLENEKATAIEALLFDVLKELIDKRGRADEVLPFLSVLELCSEKMAEKLLISVDLDSFPKKIRGIAKDVITHYSAGDTKKAVELLRSYAKKEVAEDKLNFIMKELEDFINSYLVFVFDNAKKFNGKKTYLEIINAFKGSCNYSDPKILDI